jgi:hypothetical protein
MEYRRGRYDYSRSNGYINANGDLLAMLVTRICRGKVVVRKQRFKVFKLVY